jgi:Arc/MetJ-type ribon-helix-helix transcriptional regulator
MAIGGVEAPPELVERVVRAALLEGEASGEPKRFDISAFKQRMLHS